MRHSQLRQQQDDVIAKRVYARNMAAIIPTIPTIANDTDARDVTPLIPVDDDVVELEHVPVESNVVRVLSAGSNNS